MADLKKYRIESMTTKVGSRLQRYQSPTRHSENIFVAGRRLLADRYIDFTVEEFEKNKKEIEAKLRAGMVRVITPDGTIVDSVAGGRMTMQCPGQPIRMEDVEDTEAPIAGVHYPLPPVLPDAVLPDAVLPDAVLPAPIADVQTEVVAPVLEEVTSDVPSTDTVVKEPAADAEEPAADAEPAVEETSTSTRRKKR